MYNFEKKYVTIKLMLFHNFSCSHCILGFATLPVWQTLESALHINIIVHQTKQHEMRMLLYISVIKLVAKSVSFFTSKPYYNDIKLKEQFSFKEKHVMDY